MKEVNKKVVKKTVLAGAGTAAGAAIGAVVEQVVDTTHDDAEDIVEADVIEAELIAEPTIPYSYEPHVGFAAATVELVDVVVVGHGAAPSHTAQHTPADTHTADFHTEAVDDEPIMAAVVSAAPVEAVDPYDDIVVVNGGADTHGDAFTVHANIAAQGPEIVGVESHSEPLMAAVSGGSDLPDYLSEDDFDMKADGIGGMDIAGIDSMEMPDYINNANIDSFTDSI
ncbi:MAG: hypothetical protein K2L00_01650 [Muribaculaceae bacterium]|nr:hypothetical protein [Muribaculaceae bacterium]